MHSKENGIYDLLFVTKRLLWYKKRDERSETKPQHPQKNSVERLVHRLSTWILPSIMLSKPRKQN